MRATACHPQSIRGNAAIHPHLRPYLSAPLSLPRNIWWRLASRPSAQRHVFVLGAPRSGTTLLTKIVAAHPAFCTVNYETTGLVTWRQMEEVIGYYERDVPVAALRRLCAESSDFAAFYDAYAGMFLLQSKARRFVDSFVTSRWNIALAIRAFPEARFLHVVRDGRDAFCSARRHPHIPQARSAAAFARMWRDVLETRERHRDDPRFLDVRYEALVREPERMVRGAMQWLGESFDPVQITPAGYARATNLHETREHHRNLANPISASSIGRWRAELSAEDQRVFEKTAGGWLRRFGSEATD